MADISSFLPSSGHISPDDPALFQGPPPMLDTSFVRRKWLDLPYASQSPAQMLDIYLPEIGEGPFPVIFYIHGGAWEMCDKRDMQLLPMLKGIEHGFAVVSINYRLSSEAIFPAQIFDVKSALRFVKANAEKYLLDKTKIATWGASAGGHLCALLGTSTGVTDLEDLTTGNADQNTSVVAVVDWFGPTQDFLQMDGQLVETGFGVPDHSEKGSPESRLLGEQITLIPDLVKKASPIAYISPEAPCFLIQHGRHDQLVPAQQSIHFAEELARIAGEDRVILEIFEDHIIHADPYFESEENLKKVFAFLDSHLKARCR